jgi:hypothetical protein
MKVDSKYHVCFLFFIFYRESLKSNKVSSAYLKPGVGRKLKEIENLEDLGVDGRAILKCIKVPNKTMD